ncbi:ATP-dependent DNA helicase RecG [Paludibacter propionicigenes WB4]|uniref:ATP-dependent DNA helicase RecG n=1 Tax=Paludibacter propionicigenes (strain DSM 17365 / JCM 13257 / WB4) TaxID=694427 RepID=E4T727_PALPW|nr:ATP-dependent DNA helicase RecG [Paludibacter propionicigenes]ADQ80521.1 ATP-dependent DNA helicase RecG [Paludibacter propionicigenes WB4]
MDLSSQDIKFLPGVGPKKADLLNKELGIRSAEDLLRHYPYKYVDRSRFYYLHEISEDMPFIQVKGQIIRFEKVGEGPTQRLTAIFTDGRETIELVWFKGVKYVIDKYKTGVQYVVFGKPSPFNGRFNIVHPEIELVSQLPPPEQMGLQPFYNTSEKMKNSFLNSKMLQKIIFPVIQSIKPGIPDTLPAYLLQKFALMNLTESLVNVHFPKNANALNKARQRLKFEELFYIQLNILQQTKWRDQHFKGFVFGQIGHYFNTFFKDFLPFELTGAQKRVLREIRIDVASGRQMNRLLQGDVGSGKTLVALMAMLMAVDNGFQACIMAPTEILATQHFASLTEFLGDMGVSVALLTGSTRPKARVELHEKLRSGELNILIGTHALIEDTVQFSNLGLVVIDEQHRFGVEQRARLWRKNVQPPHILVMTATPIPRTLAMTLYGDLSVSVIDELPPGRKPIQTYHYYENKRQGLNQFIAKQVEAGRQIYIVYPLIQESEKIDLQNLETGYEYMREVFPTYTISKVHGKLKPAEKDHEMQKFVTGQTQIMVATTVIEVGVNVPNASVMVIESAQRFGLSQLHQLRGRVGRGAEQSFCILLTDYKLASDTRKRMEIMVRTNDGFEISEADLKLRGPGDLEGTQQSGLPFDLKIANLAQDGKMLEIARNAAMEILEDDPQLIKTENRVLATQLRKMKTNTLNWGSIS